MTTVWNASIFLPRPTSPRAALHTAVPRCTRVRVPHNCGRCLLHFGCCPAERRCRGGGGRVQSHTSAVRTLSAPQLPLPSPTSPSSPPSAFALLLVCSQPPILPRFAYSSCPKLDRRAWRGKDDSRDFKPQRPTSTFFPSKSHKAQPRDPDASRRLLYRVQRTEDLDGHGMCVEVPTHW